MGYEPTGKDMNSYIEDYLEHIAGYRGLSDATVKTYVQDLETFMNFLEMMEVLLYLHIIRQPFLHSHKQ